MSISNDDRLMALDAEAGRRLLKKLILDANPGLADPDIELFEAMCIIRRWVSESIPVGSVTELFDNSILYNIIECLTGRGAFNCGGLSHILGYVYGLFGLKAVVYGYGILGVYTHVVTLVSAGPYDPYVQDALFNATYVHADGAPMTFGTMCGLLKAHRAADIVRVVDCGTKKRVVRNFFGMSEEVSCRSVDVADMVCAHDASNLKRIAEVPAAGEFFARHDLPMTPEYVFLARRSVSFPRGRLTKQRIIIDLVENNTFSCRETPELL